MKKNSTEYIQRMLDNEEITQSDISQEIKNSMISYAMLVICDRAIPNVLDGLKPAQRRILYSCMEEGYDYDKPFKKCARIAGNVMGKYHPHSSCYGTLANMSQNWKFRYPLIDFHGSNGSISGDAPAADRYTEARLAKISSYLLEDVKDECSVDFIPNYDETTTEPVVLPGLLPVFLIEGASGIAVGMKTECPSHNLTEVCDALIYAISNPYTLSDLLKYIKGPDAPTGASITKENIKSLYETGKASITYRSNYKIETNPYNGNPEIVFIDIPPTVKTEALIEKILKLISEKKLQKIQAVRDESEENSIRLVIECAKSANLQSIISSLYNHTDLEKSIKYVMYGVYQNAPKIITLMDYFDIYIENRKEVVKRRMLYLTEKEQRKLEIMQGVAKVIDKIKTVIKEIIEAEDDKSAIELLKTKYNLTDIQANYILDRKSRSLVKRERGKIHEDINKLKQLLSYHTKVLNDENELKQYMINELTQLKEEFGDARRTKIVKSFSDYTSTQEEDKSYYVVLTNKNLKLVDKIKNLAEGKTLYKTYFQAKSNDYIWIILKTGELVQTKVIDIPNTQINNIADIFPVSDKILLTITSDGFLKKTEFSKLVSGKNLFSEKHTIVKNLLISDTEDEVVTIATKSGGITRFKPNCKTSGVNTKGIQISSIINDEIIDVQVSLESEDKNNSCLILAKADNYFYKVVPMSSILIKGRTAKTLNYITNKEKPELFKIYINQSPQYYDMKNDLITIEQYKTKQRLEKMDILKGVPNTFEVNQL